MEKEKEEAEDEREREGDNERWRKGGIRFATIELLCAFDDRLNVALGG